MRRWLLGISLAALPFLASASARLIHSSIHQTGNRTEIKLTLSKKVAHHAFSLESPPRLVIDLTGTKAPKLLKKKSTSLVKKVRAGTWHKTNTRLVFDLKQASSTLILQDHSKKNSKTIHLSLSPRHKKTSKLLSRIQQAASPIWLKRIKAPSPRKRIKAPSSRKRVIVPPSDTQTTTAHQSPQRFIIIVDPGHGGKDPGASGERGHLEKNIVLAIAKKLQRILNRQPYYQAILTRHNDRYLTLRDRLKIARVHHANLFISIHADAFRRHGAHGASVYALSERGASSEAAHWLASKENDSELLGGVNLDNKTDLLKSVLIDLSQSASVRESMDLGRTVLIQLDNVTKLHHRRVEEAAFVVLKSPDIPSLLIETGFLSNPKEERKLIQSEYQYRLAVAISHGIDLYMYKKRSRGEQVRHSRQ